MRLKSSGLASAALCLAIIAGLYSYVAARDFQFWPAKSDQFQLDAQGINNPNALASRMAGDAQVVGQAVLAEAIAVGPDDIVDSADEGSILKLLYGNYDEVSRRALRKNMIFEADESNPGGMANGYASVLKTIDYHQGGKQKRAIIIGTRRLTDGDRLLIGVCLLVRDKTQWRVAVYQPWVTSLAGDKDGAHVDWQQIGVDAWALKTKSTGSTIGAERFVQCALYEPRGVSLEQIFVQSESFESKNNVDIDIKMLPDKLRSHWDILMTSTEKKHGSVSTLMSLKGDSYEAVRVYPYLSKSRISYPRGIPATDWDGSAR